MKVNENYYGEMEFNNLNTIKYTSKKLNGDDFLLNSKLDDSITLSASQSNINSPLLNLSSVILDGDNSYSEKIETGEIQKFALIYNPGFSTDGFTIIGSENPLAGMYKYRYGYNVSNYGVTLNSSLNNHLVSGYNYYTIYGTIYVEYANSNNTIYNVKLSELPNDYHKILSVSMKLNLSQTINMTLNTINAKTWKKENNNVNSNNLNFIYYFPLRFPQNSNDIPLLGCGTIANISNNYNSTLCYHLNEMELITIGNQKRFACVNGGLSLNNILKYAATYGIIFTDGGFNGVITDENINNEHLYIPTINDNGFYNGEYTKGNDNLSQKQVIDKWNNDINAPFNNGVSDFDNIDDTKYITGIPIQYPSPAITFTNKYLVSASNLVNLAEYLNNSDKTIFDNIIYNLSLAGSNPLNAITSIYHIPINIDGCYGSDTGIIIGKITTDVNKISGKPITLSLKRLFLGETEIYQEHKGNFLDFSPYTEYEIFIPFCGNIPLESDVISGNVLSVYMDIDIISGSCSSSIYINSGNGDILYKTVSGNCITQVSIQGFDTSTYISGLLNGVNRFNSGVNSIVSGAIGVNDKLGSDDTNAIFSILNGANNVIGGLYDAYMSPKQFTEIGTMSGNCWSGKYHEPVIFKYTCEPINDNYYSENVGFACEFSDVLKNLRGFVQCNNANVECDGTFREKQEIKSLLEHGIYIN